MKKSNKRNHFRSNKAAVLAFVFLLMFSTVLAAIPLGKAAGAITLSSTTVSPGDSVTIIGSGFGAEIPVGIGFGAEVNVINESMIITGPFDVDTGPYVSYASRVPIKPGTFTMSVNVSSTVFLAVDVDFGNGTLGDPFSIFTNGTLNYATGERVRFTKSPVSSATYTLHLVNYTSYEYEVTPAEGITTDSSGAFTALITVPSVVNGDYSVTAIDTEGNVATAILNTVPEGLTLGVMLLLSTVAVIVSIRYFRKRPKWQNW